MGVVQAMLPFGSNIWVLVPRLEKSLAGFHHQATRQMAGMGLKRQPYRIWVYPPIGVALAMMGIEDIGLYIPCHKNMIAQYIVTCPIMDLCLETEQKPGMCLSRRWWEHPPLDILGIRAGRAAAEGGEETGTEKMEGEV